LFLAVVSAAALGVEGIAAKLAYAGGANIFTALTFRFLIAAAFFWVILLSSSNDWKLGFAGTARLVVLAICGQGSTVMLLFYSFSCIPAAVTILLLYIYPSLVTLLAFFLLQEQIDKAKVIALVLTFSGLVIILGIPGENLDARGVIAALMAAVTNSFYVIGQTQVLKKVEPLVFNAYASLAVGFMFLFMAAGSGQFSLAFNLQAAAAIAVLALVCSVVAYYSLARALKYIGASRVAIISTIEPLVTAVLGYLFLKETLQLSQITGGFLILTGIVWLQIAGQKAGNDFAAYDIIKK